MRGPSSTEATVGVAPALARARAVIDTPCSSAMAVSAPTAASLASSVGSMNVPSREPRDPSGGAWPGRYFPVSQPPVSGLQTRAAMSSSVERAHDLGLAGAHQQRVGELVGDGSGHAEGVGHARRCRASIGAVSTEVPQWPTRPRSMRAPMASTVSSIGVDGSGRCSW